MNKKVWLAAAAAIVVCIAGAGGISALGGAGRKAAQSGEASSIVTQQGAGSAEELENKEEKTAEETAEKSAGENTEKSAEETAEKSAQENTEKSAEETAEKSAQENTEKSAEETIEKVALGTEEQAASETEANTEEKTEDKQSDQKSDKKKDDKKKGNTGKNTTIVDLSMTGAYYNEDDGDGYKILEDGTFTAYSAFKEEKGKMIGTLLPQGEQWVFTSPGLEQGTVTGTFNDEENEWTIDGKIYRETLSSMELESLHFRGLYVNGKSLFIWGRKMQNLEKNDLACTVDLNQMMTPGQISGDIIVTCGDASAYVRAVNPYEKDAPLSDCLVCSFYTEDTTGTFSYEVDGCACGEECFDKLLEPGVYSYQKDRLVYKEYMPILSDYDYVSGEDPRGNIVMDPSGDCDLTFTFDGAVLRSFCYTSPGMLYSNLDKNVDEDVLASMTDEQKAQIIETRSAILAELQKSIKEAGIDTGSDAGVDDTTGEASIRSTVLFEDDSADLIEDGKQYLDQLVKACIPVLFSDTYKDAVTGIIVEGHTGSAGFYGNNMDLSCRRADAVLGYCEQSTENGLTDEQKAMLREKTLAKGYADTEPVYDENGKEDKEASDRIAVRFCLKAQ